jgi:beta-phosphoglucomutase-like phosphatase (HAD superfamily)
VSSAIHASAEAGGAGLPPRTVDLDRLATDWWSALDAAQAALRAADLYLGSEELGRRGFRLARERVEAVELLDGLAHDLHARVRLLSFLASPAVTSRMLGLPSDVIACVFDLDGVLTASAGLHASAWAETFDAFLLGRSERGRRHFIPFDRHGEYDDHLAGRSRLEGVRSFLASRGISLPEGAADDSPGVETVHGLGNRKNEVLQRRLAQLGVAAFEGSRSYLEALRMLGIRCAVVSPSANTRTILQRAGITEPIDVVVDGEVIDRQQLRVKPAPDTLLAACRALRALPEQVTAFETTTVGIAAARSAHVRLVVGVDRTGHAGALRASDADLVIDDLAELLDSAPHGL